MEAIVGGLALLIHYWLGSPEKWHPLRAYARFADVIGNILDVGTHRFFSSIMGVFAAVLLIAPVVLLVEIARASQSLAYVVDLVVLLLLLQVSELRNWLSARANTEKSKLPTSALSDAVAQTSLRLSNQFFGILFYYACGGIFFAVAYRLLLEVVAVWRKTNRNTSFISLVYYIDNILRAPPSLVMLMLFCLFGNARQVVYNAWHFASYFRNRVDGILIAGGAGALSVAIRANEHLNAAKKVKEIGRGRSPVADDIPRLQKLVFRVSVAGALMLPVLVGIRTLIAFLFLSS
jgi:cobalamin biosynthesis protein CobD/CbiB